MLGEQRDGGISALTELERGTIDVVSINVDRKVLELPGSFLIKAWSLLLLGCARALGRWRWPGGQPFPTASFDISPRWLSACLKMAEAVSWGFVVDVSHCPFFREALDQETMFLVITLHVDLFSYAFNRSPSFQLLFGLNSGAN